MNEDNNARPPGAGAAEGRAFPSEDVLNEVHGAAQAVWDIRRLLSWIRSQQPDSMIGLNGFSPRRTRWCCPGLSTRHGHDTNTDALLVFAAGSLVGVELDMDQVRAGDGHRPAQVRLVHTAVFDIECGEAFYPAQQLIVVGDTQTEQRVSAQCGQRLGGAQQQQTGTARMLQQHGRYLVFEFFDQEGGEIEDPYIPVAGRQRIAGRHSDVV